MEQAGYNGAQPHWPLCSSLWSRLDIMEITLTGLYTVGYGTGWA
jgi:hypothetical protein